MRERQDVILGGGLSGLTAAYTLQAAGEDHWQLYEREARVGGLARSIAVDGYLFDFGPHILFTIDVEMEALIRDLLGDNFHAQERQAFIYHHACDRYTRFPFQAHLHGLPVPIVKDCLLGLLHAAQLQARGEFHPRNYEEWMRGFFGDGIADHLMIPYARKIWTVEPSEMDFSWIGRRVPTPDFERILLGALTDDVSQVGATAYFWYPKRGAIEPLPRALGERIHNVHLNRAAERIELPAKNVVFRDGLVVPFERLILSLPLHRIPELVTGVPPEVERACRGLRYQGIYCVNLGIDRENISDKHWVYFYEDLFPFHRLSFPAAFSPDTVPPGKSSIATEVAFSRDRPLDRDAAVTRTIEALRQAKILHPDDKIELVHTEEILPAYVIYDLDHAKNVGTIRSWLKENGIWSVGRFGEWQYFNMDHSMRSGKTAALEILAGRNVGR
ncbi:MAG TPA: FAD-dependent oxidoreductase [Thermoanaerobaculia bacterium]|nr:FAD-dependent oxidoreductase [Thermoanaerobaculia bacterium]